MAEKTVSVRLRAEVAQYVAGLQKAKVATKDLTRELTGGGKTAKADLDQLGRTAAIASGSIALGFAAAAKTAIDWESAWAGVTKTVEGSEAEMAGLEEGLRNMAKELPATHQEIAAVAEAAGALGVSTPYIESFTRTMIDLGETTDLTADQAATSMAQIANVMKTPQDKFDEMGSTLVELGNNGASTESQILELSNRLAGAGAIAGLSEANVFAFASTLASVGVEAEAGGSALSKVFIKMRDATLDGGEALETFAEVAGMTASEFAAAFAADPAAAIDTFIQGLGRINDAGQSTTGVFKDLEMTDVRLTTALLKTAGAGDLLAESISTADNAWRENNALQTEAEKRYATTGAQMEMLRNQIVDVGIGIGAQLLPAVNGAVDVIGKMASGFGSLEGPAGSVLTVMGGLAGAGTGVVAAFAILGPKIKAMHSALLGLGAAGKMAAASMPWLAAAAAAVGAVSFLLGEQAQEAEAAEERVKGYTDAIKEVGSVTGGAVTALAELAEGNAGVADAIEQSGMSLEEWAAALTGSDAEFEAFQERLLDSGTGFELFGSGVNALAEGILPRMREEMVVAGDNAGTLSRVLGETGTAAQGSVPGIEASTGALGDEATAAEDAEKALKNLIDARRGQIDPLFSVLDAYQQHKTAQDELMGAAVRNTDAIDDNNVSVAEMDKLYRDAAGAALDVEASATELQFAMANGAVSTEQAAQRLEDWVANGLLTEEQAVQVGEQIGVAMGMGEQFGFMDETGAIKVDSKGALVPMADAKRKAEDWKRSRWTTTVDANKKPADNSLSGAKRTAEQWKRSRWTSTVDGNNRPAVSSVNGAKSAAGTWARGRYTATLDANAGPAFSSLNHFLATARNSSATVRFNSAQFGGETGGRTDTIRSRPGRSDTIPLMTAPGEFIIKASSARALGYGNLEAMNRTGRAPAGTGNAVQTYGVPTGGGGGSTNVLQVSVDARGAQVGVGREIVDALTRWSRDNGPLPAAVVGG